MSEDGLCSKRPKYVIIKWISFYISFFIKSNDRRMRKKLIDNYDLLSKKIRWLLSIT